MGRRHLPCTSKVNPHAFSAFSDSLVVRYVQVLQVALGLEEILGQGRDVVLIQAKALQPFELLEYLVGKCLHPSVGDLEVDQGSHSVEHTRGQVADATRLN